MLIFYVLTIRMHIMHTIAGLRVWNMLPVSLHLIRTYAHSSFVKSKFCLIETAVFTVCWATFLCDI